MSEYKSESNLEKVLKAGHFAFTGECGPPEGADVEQLRKKASYLKGCVDAVNVTDNQTLYQKLNMLAQSLSSILDAIGQPTSATGEPINATLFSALSAIAIELYRKGASTSSIVAFFTIAADQSVCEL